MLKLNGIKKWSFACVILLMMMVVSGCSMSYSSEKILEERSSNNWSIDFQSLNGDLAHRLSRTDGKPSTLHINSAVESGTLTIHIQSGDQIEEIETGEQKVDLSKWGNAEIILRIIADNAQDGHVYFTWE